jgi:hypothetical protein
MAKGVVVFVHYHNLVQLRIAYGFLYRFSIGIAVRLFDGFPVQFLHAVFEVFVPGILQFDNVAVLHVGIDVQ